MNRRPADEELRQWLRAGDPLPPGEELPHETAAGMRRVVLAAEPRPVWPVWRVATVAAALIAVLAAAWWIRPAAGPDSGANKIATHVPPAAAGSETAARTPAPVDRQIQFVTRGGTRVIWTLKPRIDS